MSYRGDSSTTTRNYVNSELDAMIESEYYRSSNMGYESPVEISGEEEEEEEDEWQTGRSRDRMKWNSIHLYCEICDISCSSTQLLQTHFGGSRHKKNLEKVGLSVNLTDFVERPKDVEIWNKLVKCLLCKIVLLGCDSLVHTKCPTHQEKLKIMSQRNQEFYADFSNCFKPICETMEDDLKDKRYFCEVCLLEFSGEDHLKIHVEGKKHLRRVREMFMMEVGEERQLGIPCGLCRIYVHSVDELESHFYGRGHQQRVQEYTSRVSAAKATKSVDHTSRSDLDYGRGHQQRVQEYEGKQGMVAKETYGIRDHTSRSSVDYAARMRRDPVDHTHMIINSSDQARHDSFDNTSRNRRESHDSFDNTSRNRRESHDSFDNTSRNRRESHDAFDHTSSSRRESHDSFGHTSNIRRESHDSFDHTSRSRHSSSDYTSRSRHDSIDHTFRSRRESHDPSDHTSRSRRESHDPSDRSKYESRDSLDHTSRSKRESSEHTSRSRQASLDHTPRNTRCSSDTPRPPSSDHTPMTEHPATPPGPSSSAGEDEMEVFQELPLSEWAALFKNLPDYNHKLPKELRGPRPHTEHRVIYAFPLLAVGDFVSQLGQKDTELEEMEKRTEEETKKRMEKEEKERKMERGSERTGRGGGRGRGFVDRHARSFRGRPRPYPSRGGGRDRDTRGGGGGGGGREFSRDLRDKLIGRRH